MFLYIMICLIADASDTTWMIRRVIPGSTYFLWVGLPLFHKFNILSMLNPVFELVSAYGTVGLSLGVPNVCRYLSWIYSFNLTPNRVGWLLVRWCTATIVQAHPMHRHASRSS